MIGSLQGLAVRYRYALVAMTLAWMLFIFLLSAQSAIHMPRMFFHQDKALHSLLFATLGFLLSLLVMADSARPALWQVVVVTLLVMGYGGLDEFHQSFVPGRTPDIFDLAADTLGGLFSSLLVLAIFRSQARR